MGIRIKHLNVGCGNQHERSTDDVEWINLDWNGAVNPDLCCDITKGLPFENDEISYIKAIACLGQIERNADFLAVMNEFWSVLNPNGVLFIYLPHTDYPHIYVDPFNQRRTNILHWEGFDEMHAVYRQHLSYYGFKPWTGVTVSLDKDTGFMSIYMKPKK